MTPAQRLALARVQVADVVRLLNRRLRKAGYYNAAAVLTDVAMDVAQELSERAESGSALRADFSGLSVVGTAGENPASPTHEEAP